MDIEAPPSTRTLAEMLRRITERLALDLTRPNETAPPWTDTEWRIATAVVTLQGMSVPMSNHLRWRGPDRWLKFLQRQKAHTELRHVHIRRTLEGIDAVMRRIGVPVVALKGAALYGLRVYEPGERPMADIDLLARAQDLGAVKQAIASIGYMQSFENSRHAAFEPHHGHAPSSFGEHADNPVKIELHGRIAEALPVSETDITHLVFPGDAAPGINGYPSIAALMLHLLLHAASNTRARALRHIQLHDIALLAVRMNASDWSELRGAAEQCGLWWALSPLTLTARYYPQTIPTSIVEAAEDGCPRRLRLAARRQTLTDVSWSNIRIQAFPGIEWSRSPLEAFAFAKSRLIPRRGELLEVKSIAESQLWGQIPWYAQSHATRILRWTLSRPPRVQTLYSIREALSES